MKPTISINEAIQRTYNIYDVDYDRLLQPGTGSPKLKSLAQQHCER